MRDFRELKVWEKAHQLALLIYRRTASFPAGERYGLTSQMRRAAVSIPGNIAEGCGKQTPADLARYLQVAMGSASELEYYCLLAGDLGYLSRETEGEMNGQVTEVKKMLTSLIRKLMADS